MRKPILLSVAATLLLAGSAFAHDLFLKLDHYVLPAHAAVRVQVLNGTFTKSENNIESERIGDLRLVGVRDTVALPLSAWTSPDTLHSVIAFTTGDEGTYVLGATVKPREITLEGAQFNAYLKEEGILDALADRRRTHELQRRATERYAKFVKAVYQVGAASTDAALRPLHYDAEIELLSNPYSATGGHLRVRAMVDGKPLAHHVILAGSERRKGEMSATTDANGEARFTFPAHGRAYVKFVSMKRAPAGAGVDYLSKWATLTFEVR
ncbi:MAG: NikM domain containing protein [Gemmatimonadetes bacterium]|nr:NikM domain containing protein [Gemmatimonadota bacterium]